MASFKLGDVRLEKPSFISKHRQLPRLMTLFRVVMLLIFLVIVSTFTTQLSFSYNFSAEHFREFSVTITSPRYVFILGNAIVITLFLLSRSLSCKTEEKNNCFDEDYMEKFRENKSLCIEKEKKVTDLISKGRIKTCRSYSGNMDKRGSEHHPVLRRSLTERCRGTKTEFDGERISDDMSGEEFRQTVEAFIARQQRIVRRK